MIPEFLRQNEGALFPQVLFNRPVTRGGAGRLLVPGGHTGEISQPTALYELSMAAGAGDCLVALPDALAKLLAGAPATTFVASSPSGSLGTEALGRLLELSEDADGVALGVSLSNNSHTAILMEHFILEVQRPVIAFAEMITLMVPQPAPLISSPDNLLIMTMPQIFKLADKLGILISIRRDGGIVNKVEIAIAVAERLEATLWIYGTEIIIASRTEAPIVTPVDYRLSTYPAVYYALASVFWLQNRTKRRESIATAAYIAGKVSRRISYDSHVINVELSKAIRLELEAASGF